MRPLYALTFQIDGDHLDDLIGDVRNWVASKYAGWNQILPSDGTPFDLGYSEHEGHLNRSDLPSGRMFSFDLSHPDRQTRGLHWRTDLTVATDGNYTECNVVLSTYVTRDGVQPPQTWQIHPPFLRQIVDRYPLRIGKEPLALRPDTAGVDEVDALVGILLMPQRRLPLVLVSEEVGYGPLVSPDDLQNRLLGTARVVRIMPEASFYFSDRLGSRLSCYDGGVRIYWPGFQLGDDEYFHKLYLKWEIRDLETSGPSLKNDIFDRITSTTSIRVRPGPLLQRLQTAQERAKDADLKRRLEEIGSRETVTSNDREAYEELLAEASESNAQLQTDKENLLLEVDKKERETKELQWKLHAAREALHNIQQDQTTRSLGDESAMRLSRRAREEYSEHAARQSTFDRLLSRLLDPVVRDEQASRCPGGGFVYPRRSNTDERVFFEMDGEVVYVCALFPHHQDSLAAAYNNLRNCGVQVSDFDGFEPWFPTD